MVRCLAKIDVRPLQAFFVIPLLSQLWEEKNYCARRNELSSWRPEALPNRHKHLCIFKLGYDVQALLSSIMYILSGKKITAVYPMSRRRWDQNTSQVANRLNWAGATYVRLLHVHPWVWCTSPVFCRYLSYFLRIYSTVHIYRRYLLGTEAGLENTEL